MIIADVFVPSIGRKYNFSLDEQALLKYLIPEIAEVICQKENCYLDGKADELVLCMMDSRQILDRSKSLSNYSVMNGCNLLLL